MSLLTSVSYRTLASRPASRGSFQRIRCTRLGSEILGQFLDTIGTESIGVAFLAL
jgi:hypothetical protein